MITLTLPDNSQKVFYTELTGTDFANSISSSLSKAAIAIKIDDNLYDLSYIISKNCRVKTITGKDPEGLEIIRHDAAHIMAEAVKELYPDTQVTIGPAIENGFYYDFDRQHPFSHEELEIIEAKMHEIIKRNEKIERYFMSRSQAIEYFTNQGEFYKTEIINSIPIENELSFYKQGNFIDLCRGPHAPSTGKIVAFKLLRVAGAYWRGDSNNKMLQRIYGTAWANKEDLKNYLKFLEEAALRDHRKIGRGLELFHLQEEAPGMVFWHSKGWIIYRIIENYIRDKVTKAGYIEVKTPIVVDKSLWEASGHWDKFSDNMYTVSDNDKVMALKPMNCPCHVQIFNQGLKSYKDLPIRMLEFGTCHRNEPSGSLHGIMRVRGFAQDDAHIFCSEDMITDETIEFCRLLRETYNDFGFKDIEVKFSDRPLVRAGSDEVWNKAEQSLKEAICATGLQYSMNPGEGAFYGPKLEFILKDAIGRDWQCGTLQVDFILPERLNASYIGKDGNKHRPVMLHRAIVGSLERFIGILIEQYSGKFPLWIAPIQVAVVTITNNTDKYATKVHKKLESLNIRSVLDISKDKINYKIRKHSLDKVPIIFVIGDKEMQNNSISVRRLGSDKQNLFDLEHAINEVLKECVAKN